MASRVSSFGNQHLATTTHPAFGLRNIFESRRLSSTASHGIFSISTAFYTRKSQSISININKNNNNFNSSARTSSYRLVHTGIHFRLFECFREL